MAVYRQILRQLSNLPHCRRPYRIALRPGHLSTANEKPASAWGPRGWTRWIAARWCAASSTRGGEVLFVAPETAIVGAAAGYLVLWSVYHLFRLLTGKEGMGYGDFKLLAAIGAWLGWQVLPMVVFLSALVGAVIGIAQIVFGGRTREQPIPYGPYLAAAGWIAMLWGQQLTDLYTRTLIG